VVVFVSLWTTKVRVSSEADPGEKHSKNKHYCFIAPNKQSTFYKTNISLTKGINFHTCATFLKFVPRKSTYLIPYIRRRSKVSLPLSLLSAT